MLVELEGLVMTEKSEFFVELMGELGLWDWKTERRYFQICLQVDLPFASEVRLPKPKIYHQLHFHCL